MLNALNFKISNNILIPSGTFLILAIAFSVGMALAVPLVNSLMSPLVAPDEQGTVLTLLKTNAKSYIPQDKLYYYISIGVYMYQAEICSSVADPLERLLETIMQYT